MNIQYQRCQNLDELKQIISLQKKNLPENISETEKKTEGFVTVSHQLDQLRRMNDVCPHILAKSENKVVGYALCMHPQFSSEVPLLIPMFNKIDEILNCEIAYMVMGQICVDKAYRSQGLFRGLYAFMRVELIPEYKLIITEVDAENGRSLHAHYKIGFTDLLTHDSGGRQWHMIQWEL